MNKIPVSSASATIPPVSHAALQSKTTNPRSSTTKLHQHFQPNSTSHLTSSPSPYPSPTPEMTIKRGSTPLKTASVNKTVFQESKFGIKSNKKFLLQKQQSKVTEPEADLVLPSQALQDKIDAENDQQVTSILDLLKKIEDFNGSQLEGNERRKYIQKKLVELGVKAPKPPNHSFKVRVAIKKAAEERQKEEKENARYAGMLAGVKSKRRK